MMRVLKVVRIELEINKHVTISNVLYYFWQLLYESGTGLRVDKIMRNHCAYTHEFCTKFRKKLLELMDYPEYMYMLGIAMLLDGGAQINKIYRNSVARRVVERVEAGNDEVGKHQTIF